MPALYILFLLYIMHIHKFFVEKKHTHTNPFYKLYLILQKQKKSRQKLAFQNHSTRFGYNE